MFDSLCRKIESAACTTQRNLHSSRSHDEYCDEFASQLEREGVTFHRQMAIPGAGIPDFTAFENGISVCHIEVKAKQSGLNTEDIEQAKKYKVASRHQFVYLINFGKIDGPNIRKE